MRPIPSVVMAVLAPILANCSTHPLVDDVTRSTTFDVVDKIRCEAKQGGHRTCSKAPGQHIHRV